MSINKVTNNSNFSKSNYKILKLITIVLSILIFICLVLLVIGFVNKFDKITKNEVINNNFVYNEYDIFYPNGSKLITLNFNKDNNLVVFYEYLNENYLIVIDLNNKKILNKVNFKKSDFWKIK